MLPPFNIPPNNHKKNQTVSNTNLDDNSKPDHDVERPQMTSSKLKRPQTMSKECSPIKR